MFQPCTDVLDPSWLIGVMHTVAKALMENMDRIGDVLFLLSDGRLSPIVKVDKFDVEANTPQLNKNVSGMDSEWYSPKTCMAK